MKIAISTNWSVSRHKTGESLVDEALKLGFDALELGYNTTDTLAEGIKACVEKGRIAVDSVHAYCPVPFNAPHGYPELHLLASLDEDERALAALLLGRTLEFASKMGAKAVVLHAGRIFLNSFFGDVGSMALEATLSLEGEVSAPKYQWMLKRAWKRRTSRAKKVIPLFCQALEKLLPKFEKAGITLCLENLPSIEAYPDEREILELRERFSGAPLAYWHDMGHGQVRANMGWIQDHAATAKSLLPVTGGIHIHDCAPLAHDHLSPGEGNIFFPDFAFYGKADLIRVFEPSPQIPPEEIANALCLVRKAWGDDVPARV